MNSVDFNGFRNLDRNTGTIAKVLESKSMSCNYRDKSPGLIALAVVGNGYTDDAVLKIADRIPDGQSLWVFSPIHRRLQHPKLLRCTHVPAPNRRVFQRKVLSHVDAFLKKLPQGTPFSPHRLPFPTESRNYTWPQYSPEADIRHTVTVEREGVPFEFFSDLRSTTDKLVVFGQDALTRGVLPLPYFFRWKWSHRIEASVMILNDPTLYLDDSLDAGWWIGTQNRDYAAEGVEIVQVAMNKLGLKPEDVLFVGISAGGFSALQMATLLPGSKAISEIPYLTLFAGGHIEKVANQAISSCLGFESAQEVPESLTSRIDVIKRMEQAGHIPDFLVIQNDQDRRHMESQYGPFKVNIPNLEGFNPSIHKLMEYSQHSLVKGGHFPLHENVLLRLVDNMLRGDLPIGDRLSNEEITIA